MTAFVDVLFADILRNGLAFLAVCVVVYLMRLEFGQKGNGAKTGGSADANV
jgi:hypothetical protein